MKKHTSVRNVKAARPSARELGGVKKNIIAKIV